MIRAVLLDLDGTLVDALSGWGEAFGEALTLGAERYPVLGTLGDGPSAHLDVFRPLVAAEHAAAGGGEWQREFLARAFARLLERVAEADEALAARMFEHYETAWQTRMRPYEEVPALLDGLHGRYRLGIVSNGLAWEQERKIAPLGLDRYFDVVAISSALGVRKPTPAIFEHALEALGVAPEQAVHVGDDLRADIGGAQAARLRAAVYVDRLGQGAVLAEAEAPAELVPDYVLRDLGGLPAILEELG